MGRAIGIDLGTTNTAVAVMRDGRPRVLEDDKGYNVFPSCISLADDGSFFIGRTAKSLIMTRPDRTVYAAKRLVGRRFDAPEVLAAQRRVGYLIEEAPDGLCQVVLDQQRLTPVDISARILAEVKRAAEASLGEEVDQAVITVPAYFNNNQRQATIEAARKAGLRCDRLLNEPTAAALAYGFRRDYDRTILVFDLGGGTFDVSILQLASGVYETLSTRGDTYLGGEDFDFRLVDHLADDFQNQHGVDLREDVVALQRLKDAAERAKCELSFTDQTAVLIPRVTASRNLESQISRVTLEELVEDLVQRTLDVTRRAVSDAGLKLADIDDVVLVGGQTRMPRVREAITAMFQKEPSRGVHPEEVVAVGAAVHASSLVEDDTDAPILLDVTPFNLGIDIAGGLFQPIITRNMHVPISATKKFVTARENQESVRVVVRQGESKFAAENEFLGEFMMGGLTPGANLRTQVEVSFRLDSNGMLHVSASEPSTGERKKVTVRNYAQYAAASGAKVALDLDGGSTEPGTSQPDPRPAPQPAAADASADAAAEEQEKPKKRGFFSGLFSRRKATEPAPPPAEVEPAEAPITEPEPLPEPSSEADTPAILLPENAVPVELDGEDLIEDEVTDHGLSGPAVLGMADSSSSMDLPALSLEPLGDALLSPADEDEDEEIQDVQLVGLSPDEETQDIQLVDSEPVPLDGDSIHGIQLVDADPEPQDDSEDFSELGTFDDGLDDLGGEDLFSFELPADEPEDNDEGFSLSDLEDLGPQLDVPEAEEPLLVPPPEPAPEPEDDFDFGDLELDLGDLGFGDDEDEDEDEDEEEDIAPAAAIILPTIVPVPEPEPEAEPVPLMDEELDLGDLDGLLGDDVEPDEEPTTFASLSDIAAEAARSAASQNDSLSEEDGDFGDLEFDLGDLDDLLKESEGPEFAPAPASESDDLGGLGDLDLGSLESLFEAPAPATEDATLAKRDGATSPRDLDEITQIQNRPEIFTPVQRPAKKRRKPARLKLAYKQLGALVSDYRDNLRRGGCVVNTPKPLSVGRECVITVRAPGLDEPLTLSGVVTWSSKEGDESGRQPGMGIEYRFEAGEREALESLLSGLV